MKILFLTRKFYPSKGGVETHTLQIAKRLRKKGHTVTVITETDSLGSINTKDIKKRVEGIDVYYLNFGKDSKVKKFKAWGKLLMRSRIITQADIIHCHDVFYLYLPFRFLLFRKNVYTTFHGYETDFPPRSGAVFLRKISSKLSKGTILVGDFIQKWYGTAGDYVTYGGVENDKKARHVTPEKNSIIFIGRIAKDTGVFKYAKALETLSKTDNISFRAYGDGSERKMFEKFGMVHGFVENIGDAIDRAEIIFASSYLVMLDALAKEKMVIAVYDNELKKEYLEMSPFSKYICICKNENEVVQIVQDFLSGRKRHEKMRKAGSNWAKMQTWDSVVDMYLKLWEK